MEKLLKAFEYSINFHRGLFQSKCPLLQFPQNHEHCGSFSSFSILKHSEASPVIPAPCPPHPPSPLVGGISFLKYNLGKISDFSLQWMQIPSAQCGLSLHSVVSQGNADQGQRVSELHTTSPHCLISEQLCWEVPVPPATPTTLPRFAALGFLHSHQMWAHPSSPTQPRDHPEEQST